jgi:hypothetical protein
MAEEDAESEEDYEQQAREMMEEYIKDPVRQKRNTWSF